MDIYFVRQRDKDLIFFLFFLLGYFGLDRLKSLSKYLTGIYSE